jgi:ribosomal subunit interface protein
MKVDIKATKIDLTPEIKDYVQEKMDMLEKFLGSVKPISCHVEVGLTVGGQQSGEIYRAEINMKLPLDFLRIEKTEKELYKAIDKAKDHMARSIVKYKETKLGK